MEWMISYENRNVFQYCPLCSARALKVHKKSAFVCTECGLEFYLNVAAAVAALIEDEQGRLLAVVRACKPKEGMLDLPGGFVDPGETAEEALRREVMEELGLQVEDERYFGSAPNRYLYKGVLYATEDLAFVCKVSDFSPLQKKEAEIRQVLFLRPEEIQPERFAFDSIRQFLQKYRARA
ncbi:MAG TPA: NUDIX domain-containing protein [Anaerohalosphaeraceae bacterium]|nr:NUDIX domain-containing protein [Anaerohalosphaeraceae bacterium]HQG05795.1 NUDIX domain-containing protein [Anaerohalosphaeraceae bacterium]HQI06642.1 NUDIX domain-containing protein [Anaerohalosphaeraceae bacterium]HQJ67480.1 NUDIX domain-containing protein [Anaerohalosphaeraceae bacterium]